MKRATRETIGWFIIGMAIGLLTWPGCHNIKGDQLFGAVVDCAKVIPSSSGALSGVETCLKSTGVGNPAACMNDLVKEAHFSVDEVACVAAWIAQQENSKIALSSLDQPETSIRDAAVHWLNSEKIAIRNTYPGAQ